jgi:hypothetical protein
MLVSLSDNRVANRVRPGTTKIAELGRHPRDFTEHDHRVEEVEMRPHDGDSAPNRYMALGSFVVILHLDYLACLPDDRQIAACYYEETRKNQKRTWRLCHASP